MSTGREKNIKMNIGNYTQHVDFEIDSGATI